MDDLHNIPLDRKLKAFQKVKGEIAFPEGKLVLLTEDLYDAALVFARESFTRDEPINHSVNTQWFPGLQEMWLETFRCHLTIALLNNDTGEVIAIRGTRILDRDYEFDVSCITDPGFKILWGIICYCDERAKFFEKSKVSQAFQMFGFGVHESMRNKGIGGRMFTTAVNMLKYLVPEPFCIKGETSSRFSSRVYEQNGFEVLYEMPFNDYLVDGKQVVCNTGMHSSLKIWGIKCHAGES